MAVFEAIATTYLESTQASVTFSSIPQTYEHLQLRGSGRTNEPGYNSALLYMQLGDGSVDTGSNYSYHLMQAGGSASQVYTATGGTYMVLRPMADGPGHTATEYGWVMADILDYVNTNKNTTVLGYVGLGSGDYVGFSGGLWDSTAAVDTLHIYPNAGDWTRGSEFTLFGIQE